MDSAGQLNTCSNLCDGAWKPKVFRGRLFSAARRHPIHYGRTRQDKTLWESTAVKVRWYFRLYRVATGYLGRRSKHAYPSQW
jgi:hypothetical protein